MQQRKLGKNGPMVGTIGLGCMSFAGFYGACNIKTAHNTLAKTHELRMTHLDTAKIYGEGLSETIMGSFLKENPGKKFSIATKGGIRSRPVRGFDNSVEYLTECLEGSLKRAHAIHPVAAVQSEYSLWTRIPELGIIQTCERIGATFFPFSPLGRGILSDAGANLKAGTYGKNDLHNTNPRFVEPNFLANQAKIKKFREYDKGISAAGLALTWILAKDNHSLLIPGTRTVEHLMQCAEGAEINLSQSELDEIETILPVGFAHGSRYIEAHKIGPEDYC